MTMPPGYVHRVQGNLLPLGPVSAQEARAVPGDSDYAARAFAQCQRFIALLRRRLARAYADRCAPARCDP